jgi:hypothetical protein
LGRFSGLAALNGHQQRQHGWKRVGGLRFGGFALKWVPIGPAWLTCRLACRRLSVWSSLVKWARFLGAATQTTQTTQTQPLRRPPATPKHCPPRPAREKAHPGSGGSLAWVVNVMPHPAKATTAPPAPPPKRWQHFQAEGTPHPGSGAAWRGWWL